MDFDLIGYLGLGELRFGEALGGTEGGYVFLGLARDYMTSPLSFERETWFESIKTRVEFILAKFGRCFEREDSGWNSYTFKHFMFLTNFDLLCVKMELAEPFFNDR